MKRFPPKRILVAAEPSGPSLSAVDAAKELARQWDAAIEIVHVEEPPVIAAGGGYAGVPGAVSVVLETKRDVENRLRGAAAGFPSERLTLRTVRGRPSTALLEAARPERADLLVMGTRGCAGLDRLLAGSVSEAVIRRARIPVLAMPERKSLSSVSRVLAPWNGRPDATHALRWAREMARTLCATLDVLYVAELDAAPKLSCAAIDARLVAVLGAGSDWTLRTRGGDARRRIVEEANSGRCELVVLSSHRRSFAADFALASTVERVLRNSAVPVLAVPWGRSRPRLLKRLAASVGAAIGTLGR